MCCLNRSIDNRLNALGLTMNAVYVGYLMNALWALSQVPGTELEQRSIAAKIKALSNSDTAGKRGKELIDAMTDEELLVAIHQRDEALDLYPHMTPEIWVHLNCTRPQVMATVRRNGW